MSACARPLTYQDFSPVSRFEVDKSLWRFSISQNKLVPAYIRDLDTDSIWWNEPAYSLRFRCVGLVFKTLFFNGICLTAARAARLVTGSHFWYKAKCEFSPYHNMPMSKRWSKACDELKQLLISPIVLLGLLLSALYGIISPNNGRKLFSNIERAAYTRDNGGYTARCGGMRMFFRASCAQPKCRLHMDFERINSEVSGDQWSLYSDSGKYEELEGRLNYTEALKERMPVEAHRKNGHIYVIYNEAFREATKESPLEANFSNDFIEEVFGDPNQTSDHKDGIFNTDDSWEIDPQLLLDGEKKRASSG